ncbi:MAG: flippase [Anaerolineae bacterium]
MADETPIGRSSVTTAGYILLSRLIGLAANIITVLLITRYLGVEGFGHYAFVMAYSLFIGTLATGGTFSILIRETARARDRAGENLTHALVVQAVFTVTAALLSVILLPIFTRQPQVIAAVYISVLASIIQVLANLFASVFTAFEDTIYLAISVFIERGVFLAGVILVMIMHWGFLSIFWSQMLSFTIKLIFCSIVVWKKFARPVWRVHWERLRYFFRESFPLLFSTGFRTLDGQIDTFLLQILQTALELGLYGAPYRLISRMNIVPDSIMAGLLPALSNLTRDAEGRRRAFSLYQKIFKYFLILTVPIAVITSLMSEPIVVLLFGAEYRGAAPALTLMVWSLVFMFPNYVFKYLLTALGQQHFEALSLAISLVPHLALDIWLIPRAGATGAAVAMLTAQSVAFIAGYYYVSRGLGTYAFAGPLLRLALGALPAAATILLWKEGPAVPRLLIAGVLYLLTLWPLGLVESHELRQFTALLRPRAVLRPNSGAGPGGSP